jgi:hypothetical protein
VRLREVAGENFVMYERTWAPGFHDLMFGILRDAGIVSNVTQTSGEVPTLISLVNSRMGITIAPLTVSGLEVLSTTWKSTHGAAGFLSFPMLVRGDASAFARLIFLE